MANYIRFGSTSIVRSSSTVDINGAACLNYNQRIELTPWDLYFLHLNYIQKGLLFYLKSDQENEVLATGSRVDVDRLKSSLSLTLDIFYPLAGRLANTTHQDGTISFFIHCNNAGAELVHAVAEGVTVSDILDPVHVPDVVESFFLYNRAPNFKEGVSHSMPLLGLQVTELVDGFFIGCSLNHAIADGSTFWHFFNTWSEISRGLMFNHVGPPQQPSPVFKRDYFHTIVTDFPIKIKTSDLPGKDAELEIEIDRTKPSIEQRVFHFSKGKIAQLKAKANEEMNTDKISSLQALLGNLWRSITRAWILDPNQEVGYRILVGTRQRFRPPLPEHYFGSATYVEYVTVKAGELVKCQGLGRAAWEINKVIASQTSEKVVKMVKDWVERPVVLSNDSLVSVKNALVTGSSPRFNVYGNDFGWGKPVAVRSGCGNKLDGKITVFPGSEEGSIDFEVCLLPETMQALEEDAEFMLTVG